MACLNGSQDQCLICDSDNYVMNDIYGCEGVNAPVCYFLGICSVDYWCLN